MPPDLSAERLHTHASSLVLDDGSSIFVVEHRCASPPAEVVIATPYGKSVHGLFVVAHYFAKNGFDVVRFDLRNHVGRSSGEVRSFVPSQIDDDLARVVSARPSGRPQILLAMSLSLPAALRVARRFPSVRAVISIVGVVDLPDTAGKILGWPRFREEAEKFAEGETASVFGYDLLVRPFLRDMDRHGYSAGLEATLEDVAKLDVPLHMIAGEEDEYVALADKRRVGRALRGGGTLSTVEGMTHEFGRSISLTKKVLGEAVRLALRALDRPGEVIAPSLTETIRASGVESSRLPLFAVEG